MIPISQEKILKRIKKFKSEKHPEFDDFPISEIIIYGDRGAGELDRYYKNTFFTLKEILSNPSEIYLSHNGAIIIAIPVEELAGNSGYHTRGWKSLGI